MKAEELNMSNDRLLSDGSRPEYITCCPQGVNKILLCLNKFILRDLFISFKAKHMS